MDKFVSKDVTEPSPNLKKQMVHLLNAGLPNCGPPKFKHFDQRYEEFSNCKKSEKVNKRHKEAVKAVRKFTKHVAGAKAVRPPKKKKNRKKDEISTPEVSNLLENVIPAPRDGKPDDLKLIAGVGPKLEGVLNGLGIYHFDQIAGWAQKEIDWIDDYLNFSGRIERDNWVGQAKALAVGGRDEYARVFGKEPR